MVGQLTCVSIGPVLCFPSTCPHEAKFGFGLGKAAECSLERGLQCLGCCLQNTVSTCLNVLGLILQVNYIMLLQQSMLIIPLQEEGGSKD